MNYEFKAIINGELVSNNEWVEIISPVTLSVVGRVPALKEEDIKKAFASAANAQKQWEQKKLFERIAVLNKWAQLLDEHKEKIAEICAHEIAKSVKDVIVEVERSIEYIEYTIEEAKRMHPEALTGDGWNIKNKIGIFKRVAKGVVLAISPFNYPINLSISKIAPSLVMGNSVVFKPATNGSLVGLYISKLLLEAGIPAGVFNAVSGRGRDIGDTLVSQPEIDLISFTGSVSVGNQIKSLSHGKDLVLELGGKDPAIVLDDVDIKKVAKDIIGGAYSYSGQRCTAIKRVLVDAKIADQLVIELKELISQLTVGMPQDNSYITPVIDEKSAAYIQELIDEALAKKATLVIGNKREKNLIWPTLIDHVTPEMRLAWEEPFGPVLPIIRCDNISKMIELANQSNFGLQASVYTQDITSAMQIAEQIEAGTININGKPQRGPDSFPFLGIKDSGQGVQGIRETLMSVTRYKGIVINY